jgi:hypothetical protein
MIERLFPLKAVAPVRIRSVTPGAWRGRLPAPDGQPKRGTVDGAAAARHPATVTGPEPDQVARLAYEWGARKQLPGPAGPGVEQPGSPNGR